MNTNGERRKNGVISGVVSFVLAKKMLILVIMVIFVITGIIFGLARANNRNRQAYEDARNWDALIYRNAQQQNLIETLQDQLAQQNITGEAAIITRDAEIQDLQAYIDELRGVMPEGINTATLQASVRQVASLVSLEHTYTRIYIEDADNRLPDWLRGRLLIFQYSGRIQAGIDFDRVVILADRYRIEVRVPEAHIISHEQPAGSVVTIRDDSGWFTPTGGHQESMDLMDRLQREALTYFLAEELLQKAQKNAMYSIRSIIYSTIKGSGRDPADFTINIRPV